MRQHLGASVEGDAVANATAAGATAENAAPEVVFAPAHHFPVDSGAIVPGDSPLHVAARLGSEGVAFRLLEIAPHLIFVRNQYDRDPVDVASSEKLRSALAVGKTVNAYERRTHFRLLRRAHARVLELELEKAEVSAFGAVHTIRLSEQEFTAKRDAIAEKEECLNTQ